MNQRRTPISIVAATTPKMSAILSGFAEGSSVMADRMRTHPTVTRGTSDLNRGVYLWPIHSGGRPRVARVRTWVPMVLATALVACSEAPSTPRTFAVLADADSSDWVMVTAGREHTCALKRDGRVFCWGSNQHGQLAQSKLDSACVSDGKRVQCSPVPLEVPLGVRFTMLSAGAYHTCGLTDGLDAFCWGANGDAQLGEFSFGEPTVEEIQTLLGWTRISAGNAHTCALRSDGVAFCWGNNTLGQAGIGSASGSISPTRVRLSTRLLDLSAGEDRACGRAVDGTVYCWGGLWAGTDPGGADLLTPQPTPTAVQAAPQMSGLSTGGGATCGFDATGFGYCWGANMNGEIGDGTQTGSASPRRIASDVELIAVSAGGAHACGIAVSGVGLCWGDNSHGQLGAPGSSVTDRCTRAMLPCSTRPVSVFGAQQFTSISAGLGAHTCGVTVRGNLYCWGAGGMGQLGDGRFVGSDIPIKVAQPH